MAVEQHTATVLSFPQRRPEPPPLTTELALVVALLDAIRQCNLVSVAGLTPLQVMSVALRDGLREQPQQQAFQSAITVVDSLTGRRQGAF